MWTVVAVRLRVLLQAMEYIYIIIYWSVPDYMPKHDPIQQCHESRETASVDPCAPLQIV